MHHPLHSSFTTEIPYISFDLKLIIEYLAKSTILCILLDAWVYESVEKSQFVLSSRRSLNLNFLISSSSCNTRDRNMQEVT